MPEALTQLQGTRSALAPASKPLGRSEGRPAPERGPPPRVPQDRFDEERGARRSVPEAALATAGPRALHRPPVLPSTFQVDLALLDEAWKSSSPSASLEDACLTNVRLGELAYRAPVHRVAREIIPIPYCDVPTQDASGTAVAGDQELARHFRPGDVGILVTWHPEARDLDLGAPGALDKRLLKQNCSHAAFVVGVPSGVTVVASRPEDSGNAFGYPARPPIFLRPRFPAHLSQAQVSAYQDNVRSLAVLMAAVNRQPAEYDGTDPIAAFRPEQTMSTVDTLVRAIAGDQEALAFFEQPAHQNYCSEFIVHVLTAGVLLPLNEKTMASRVGADVWQRFEAEVRAFQAREPDSFLCERLPPQLWDVALTFAPDSLEPLDPAPAELAYAPLTFVDLLEQALQAFVPRTAFADPTFAANLQAGAFTFARAQLFKALDASPSPPSPAEREELTRVLDAFAKVLGQVHASPAALEEALAPLRSQARGLLAREDGSGLLAPPSLLLHEARGGSKGGLLSGMDYVGHGIPWKVVRSEVVSHVGAR